MTVPARDPLIFHVEAGLDEVYEILVVLRPSQSQ